MELPYRELEVWRKAHQLAMDVLDLAETPRVRRVPFLRDQLSRAATSVPANIAEGRGRRTRNDYAGFAAKARGSVFELDYWLYLAAQRRLIEEADYAALHGRAVEVSAMLVSLIDRLRSSGD
ncbi:four helix bundle protein [Tepidiforma sp.]|uniref:four helix bundle protein n=1 Tax=Tepidiforma sp. TaxID=2682230 RepID=UPI0026060AA0|nr:four helix bundle protein [Tepidiforma sp.]MCX7619105.1 four helix bundle protein [Tepidiforma sp.]